MKAFVFKFLPALGSFTISGHCIPYLDVFADTHEQALQAALAIMPDLKPFDTKSSIVNQYIHVERLLYNDEL